MNNLFQDKMTQRVIQKTQQYRRNEELTFDKVLLLCCMCYN